MTIADAITRAAKANGWSNAKVAAEAGVSEGAATAWLKGRSIPAGDKLETLRKRLPGLAPLLDARSQAAA